MDYAVRPQISHNKAVYTANPSTDVKNSVTPNWNGNAINNYPFAPRFKRCNFLVKTDGFATLQDVDQLSPGTYDAAIAGGAAKALISFNSLDIYMEPGQFYTLYVSPRLAAARTANANPNSPLSIQNGLNVQFHWTLDEDIASVATGVNSGRANLYLVPYNAQVWTGATTITFTDSTTASNKVELSNTGSLATSTVTRSVQPTINGAFAGWPASLNDKVELAPGTYSMRVEGLAGGCGTTIPFGTLTVEAGMVYTLHVANYWQCMEHQSATTDPSVLQTVVTARAATTSMYSTSTRAVHPVDPNPSQAAPEWVAPMAAAAFAILSAVVAFAFISRN
eukprot:CAMPEP_0175813126 /NCGR_PEP_ID=MMETSP0107_2-20121207/4740_1 /TAXON_ID=195067 ORGANISM="Goniomonas pacifica, Strain CCMP1869" /NCGR_SAMPLE_ID=MMETSP0107_2 /ASSEMBLY_ACC=CAM_ASM_000203 /LENGTH=335 /DNA_ID=CAMNT_0017125027 /DNA_START=23 /DNA_END=1030 /DNA_ORIENTATION=+